MEESENSHHHTETDAIVNDNDPKDSSGVEEPNVKRPRVVVSPDKGTTQAIARNIESVVDPNLATMFTSCKEMERMIYCLDNVEYGTFKKVIDDLEWMVKVIINSNELVINRKRRIGLFHTFPGIKNPYAKDFGQEKLDKVYLEADTKYLDDITREFKNKLEHHHEKLTKSVGAVCKWSQSQGSKHSQDK